MPNNMLFKLTAFESEKIWGYERWIVSTLKNGQSLVQPDNIPLEEKLGADYPLLLKIIQANDTLSVQVHPADEYAAKYENSYGKTECWYILEAEKNASLICGLKGEYDRQKLAEAIESNALEPCLYSVPVKSGDFIFIPAGTVHAIQGGLRILEIQQPSDVTYRLYDWGRGRELHVKKSLDVIENAFKAKLAAASLPVHSFTGPFECEYFTVEKTVINGRGKIITPSDYAVCFFVLEGSGSVNGCGVKLDLGKEDVFMAACGQELEFSGDIALMKVLPKSNLV